MVVADRAALAAIRRLPGRKILFSNAPAHYAEAVIGLIGLSAWFDAVYAIEHVRFEPKPSSGAFRRLLRAERVVPERAVMVEDSLANLRTAKRLGMRTVWVSRESRSPRYVDVKVPSVGRLRRLADDLARA
jgi:putative hydrolase of the HAD superfamily